MKYEVEALAPVFDMGTRRAKAGDVGGVLFVAWPGGCTLVDADDVRRVG